MAPVSRFLASNSSAWSFAALASSAASIACRLRLARARSRQVHEINVIRNVAMALPKTMATARPEVVRVSSFFRHTFPPLVESVVQYMPSAQTVDVTVETAQVLVLPSNLQTDVVEV